MSDEKRGIAFTSGIRQDGWQVSVTARADSPVEAVAELEEAILDMIEKEYVPFVSYINKHEPYKVQAITAEELVPPAFIDDDTVAPSVVDPTSVVQAAVGLGGVESPVINGSAPIVDGFEYLGIKTQKLKASELKQGQSYEIYVDKFKRPEESKVEFYNEHSQYPAHTTSLKGAGGKTFGELFPGWEPEVGSEGALKPMFLMIVGEGATPKGNPWQNLKGVRSAA